MSESSKKGFFSNLKIIQKVKGIKHIEIVVAVILCAVVLLIYLSSISKKDSNESINTSFTSMTEYVEGLESRLTNVLSKINGAGSVSVMISFLSGPELIYATNTEEKVNSVTSSGTTTSTSTTTNNPILIKVSGSDEPLVVKEVMPEISGVIVISSGAKIVAVKLELLKAVQTLLKVPTSNIEILVGN